MINLIDKYECLTGKEVPPCFEEQIKTIENQVEKLTKAIEVHAKQLNLRRLMKIAYHLISQNSIIQKCSRNILEKFCNLAAERMEK